MVTLWSELKYCGGKSSVLVHTSPPSPVVSEVTASLRAVVAVRGAEGVVIPGHVTLVPEHLLLEGGRAVLHAGVLLQAGVRGHGGKRPYPAPRPLHRQAVPLALPAPALAAAAVALAPTVACPLEQRLQLRPLACRQHGLAAA